MLDEQFVLSYVPEMQGSLELMMTRYPFVPHPALHGTQAEQQHGSTAGFAGVADAVHVRAAQERLCVAPCTTIVSSQPTKFPQAVVTVQPAAQQLVPAKQLAQLVPPPEQDDVPAAVWLGVAHAPLEQENRVNQRVQQAFVWLQQHGSPGSPRATAAAIVPEARSTTCPAEFNCTLAWLAIREGSSCRRC